MLDQEVQQLVLPWCQGGFAAPGSGGKRIPTRPALQQAAERERGSLAGAELAHEPARGRPLGRVVFQHVGPAGLSGANG